MFDQSIQMKICNIYVFYGLKLFGLNAFSLVAIDDPPNIVAATAQLLRDT
jgi:hypothetical protein